MVWHKQTQAALRLLCFRFALENPCGVFFFFFAQATLTYLLSEGIWSLGRDAPCSRAVFTATGD